MKTITTKEKRFKELLKLAEKPLSYYSKLYKIQGQEVDDIKQQLMLKLYLRMDHYKPEKSHLSTFLANVFKNEIYRIMKKSTNIKVRSKIKVQNIECKELIRKSQYNFYENIERDAKLILDSYYQYDGYDILVKNVYDNIKGSTKTKTILSKQIFKHLLTGKRNREIAWIIGKTKSKVSSLKNEVIKSAIEKVLSSPLGNIPVSSFLS